jgi:hypothetical protein
VCVVFLSLSLIIAKNFKLIMFLNRKEMIFFSIIGLTNLMRNVRRTGWSLVNAFTQAVTNARPFTFQKGTWSYLNVSYGWEYLRQQQRLFIVHPRPALNLKATKKILKFLEALNFLPFRINFPRVFSSLNFKRAK